MSNNNDDSKRIFIQVSLSKDEKQKIKNFAKERHTSASDLIRIATFDYIRKIENPEMFNQTTNSQINPVLLEQIRKYTKKTMDLQEFILDKMNIINDMRNTLALIKKFSIKTEKTTRNIIINLFKAHNSLNPKEIIDRTNLDKEIVFSIIAELHEEDIIELTSNGRYKLK